MASSRIADSVGRVLGDRYRLTRPLGVGASAHVYVAEDVTLRRRVAIKVLHPALAGDESFLRRFRAEARVVAALRHPNILTVYDWGEDGGSPYLVMELLEGGSLRSLLDRGLLLSPAQAAAVGADAARALDYAHRRGLVHRDIKPANLIFDDEGRVTVADFGLARALAEATWTEPAGSVVGTARYAAPEAVRGERLDSKADVYALALVLVEATTGVVPFAADTTIGTLMGRVDRPIVVPAEAGPLGPVLEAAGTADPAVRLDAAGLARALERVAKELPPAAPLPLDGPLLTEGPERDSDPTEYPGRPKLFDFAAAEADPASADFGSNPVRRVRPEPALVTSASRRRRRKLWVVVLLALVLVAGGGGFAVAEMQILTPSYPVPRVVGDGEAAAAAALGRDHLRLHVTSSRYDPAATGTVLSQDPTGGRLKSGHSVSVVVSLGPQPVNVPDNLAGLSETAAQSVLTTLGLKLGQVTSASNLTVAEGLVIDSKPDSGTLLPGQAVTLVISTGKPIVRVPGLTSAGTASFAAAEAALTAVHLGATESLQFSNNIPSGHVIGLQPAAGTGLRYGAEVTVLVSKGPDLVAIPPVRGLTVPAAAARLSNAGFVVSNTVGGSGSLDGTVIATNPPVGTMALKGATVQLITG